MFTFSLNFAFPSLPLVFFLLHDGPLLVNVDEAMHDH